MPLQTLLRTLNMNLEEAVTCIWNLCEGPNPLDLSAGYSKSGGGPLVCDVDRHPDGYRIYLTYLGATSFFGLGAEILIREIHGRAKLLWSIPWKSERFLRWSVAVSAIVIGLSVIIRAQNELSDEFPGGLFGHTLPPLVPLAIVGSIFFYTGLKLVTGILYRHRLESVLRRTFDGATISNVPVRDV